MKIGVYAIAKQEESNVVDWFDAVSDADTVLLYDTGSTDKTLEIASGLPIEVHQMDPDVPFRFDIARNAALALCPTDLEYVFAVDLDMRPEPGWRDKLTDAILRNSHRPALVSTTIRQGPKAWEFRRVHSRYGWTWRRPVHEELSWIGQGLPRATRADVTLEHLSNVVRNRTTQYLDLMQIGVQEYPQDAQLCFWLGRELVWNHYTREGRAELQRFLDMPHAWPPEKAKSCELLAQFADTDVDQHHWLLLGVAYAPWRREPWYALAKYYQRVGQSLRMRETAHRLRAVSGPAPVDYLTDPRVWDDQAIKEEFLT